MKNNLYEDMPNYSLSFNTNVAKSFGISESKHISFELKTAYHNKRCKLIDVISLISKEDYWLSDEDISDETDFGLGEIELDSKKYITPVLIHKEKKTIDIESRLLFENNEQILQNARELPKSFDKVKKIEKRLYFIPGTAFISPIVTVPMALNGTLEKDTVGYEIAENGLLIAMGAVGLIKYGCSLIHKYNLANIPKKMKSK